MSEPFLGEIRMFGFTFPPRGWADCDGQLLAISQNTALFSLLGTTYGGDGRTTFALPDLRGRVALHEGTGPGRAPRVQGQQGGTETQVLTADQLPGHTHPIVPPVSNDPRTTNRPEGAVPARGGAYSTTGAPAQGGQPYATAANSTTGAAFGIMQPFLTVRFAIAVQGIFPARS